MYIGVTQGHISMKFSALPLIVLLGCSTISNGMSIREVKDEKGNKRFEVTCRWPGERGGKFDHDPIRGPLLALAASKGNDNLVQEILQGISDEKLTEVIKNQYGGQVELLYYVLNNDIEGDPRPYEETAILCASQHGHVNMIEQLLAFGVNINTHTDNTLMTPLMLAAQKGHVKTVQYLLHMNANLTAQEVGGNTALMVAIRSSERSPEDALQIIKMLIHPDTDSIDEIDEISEQCCNQAEALELATQEWESCPLDVLNFCVQPFIPFIDNGINMQDNKGMTALIHAVRLNEYDMAIFLLKSGADTSIIDKSGKKAVDYTDDPTIKSLLKKRKADQIS